MSLAHFLESIWQTGRAEVSRPGASDGTDWGQVDMLLMQFERAWRNTLAGDPPQLELPVARWAATALHRGCQFVIYRDLSDADLDRAFEAKPPAIDTSAAQYSADLSLRFLADVVRLARAASDDDPLLKRLLQLAHDWPLSSVGISGLDEAKLRPAAVSCIVSHPALLALYVDRIISRSDVSRLSHASVRREAAQAIGMYPDLAPKIAGALQHQQPTTEN